MGGRYLIHTHMNEFIGTAKLRGIFRKQKITPLPGDIVEYDASGDPDVPYVIEKILERKNYLIRPPLANVDVVLLTASIHQPEIDYYLLDQMLCFCLIHKIDVIFILTKTDLEDEQQVVEEFMLNYQALGLPILLSSPTNDSFFSELYQRTANKLVIFAGQSGVGKSSLINRFFGIEKMPIGKISKKIARGKHTTRHSELFPTKNGGYFADTPGFSHLELLNLKVAPEAVEEGYPELLAIKDQCRFSSCRHMNDLGCAIEKSLIHPKRLERYRILRQELEDIKKKW